MREVLPPVVENFYVKNLLCNLSKTFFNVRQRLKFLDGIFVKNAVQESNLNLIQKILIQSGSIIS